ncbi:succinyl-CoA:glutarate CoA-transferase isoform X3 [Notamacropus eugenii]|uniref:succinyl-CoA:glutarate CoA-transferase isoform X3 n=1 Tax=Notamacropus eugenii TaxID=9315 RepID=UPI003B677FEB
MQAVGVVSRCAGRIGGPRRFRSSCPRPDTNHVKPLDGVKILDLTRVLAGPFATMNLGDLGAEVIKVERPGAGDDTRHWGPPFVGSESTYFLSVNRNKKSIAVNIKDPKGVQIIRKLAAVCDVFVENYVPGKLLEMGLGYEDISEIAPHVVYCSITGYGQTGPMSHRAGYDAVAAALSGLMHITGPEDGDPVRPGVAMTDLATGLYSYGAIMAGLLQRYKTGRGLHIDCNLLSSQVACLTQVAANYLIGGKEAKRWGTAHSSIVPYQMKRTGLQEGCQMTCSSPKARKCWREDLGSRPLSLCCFVPVTNGTWSIFPLPVSPPGPADSFLGFKASRLLAPAKHFLPPHPLVVSNGAFLSSLYLSLQLALLHLH